MKTSTKKEVSTKNWRGYIKSVWGATILIATISTLGYVAASVYQTEYLKAFGVDSSTFNLSYSPEILLSTSVLIAIPLALFIFLSGVTYIMDKVHTFFDKRLTWYMELIIIVAIVFSALLIWLLTQTTWAANAIFNTTIFDTNTINFYSTSLIIVCILGLILCTLVLAYRFSNVRMRAKQEDSSFFTAYAHHIEEMRSKRVHSPDRGMPYILILGCTLYSILVTFPLPHQAAVLTARNKSTFSMLVTKDGNKHEPQLVVGKYSEGIIVKEYDTEKARFKNGFLLVKPGDVTRFQTYEIKNDHKF